MKAVSERQFIRILHLVLSIPIMGYIYGLVASIPQAARFTRWVAMPAVVLTGFWLWLKPRLLKWLRRRHPGGAREMLLSLAALFSLMSSAATAQSPELRVGDAFPYFSAQTVTGKPLILPEAASGKTALVIFTFGRASGKDGQAWNLRFAKDFQNPVPITRSSSRSRCQRCFKDELYPVSRAACRKRCKIEPCCSFKTSRSGARSLGSKMTDVRICFFLGRTDSSSGRMLRRSRSRTMPLCDRG